MKTSDVKSKENINVSFLGNILYIVFVYH